MQFVMPGLLARTYLSLDREAGSGKADLVVDMGAYRYALGPFQEGDWYITGRKRPGLKTPERLRRESAYGAAPRGIHFLNTAHTRGQRCPHFPNTVRRGCPHFPNTVRRGSSFN